MTDSREREATKRRPRETSNRQRIFRGGDATKVLKIRGWQAIANHLSRGGDTSKLLNTRGWLARAYPYPYPIVVRNTLLVAWSG